MTYLPQKYPIISIKDLADNIKLFKVKTSINPLPGQFFEVSVLGTGECPLASCSYQPGIVDMLVRNAGKVTNELFKLEKEDSVFIRGPFGKPFPLNKIKHKNLILVAGGTGIAPVTSLIEYVEKNRKDFGEVEIYFGFRDEKSILLKDRIDRWRRKFKVIICLNSADKNWKGEVGFINDIVCMKEVSSKNKVAFLCGPEIMMKKVTESLNKSGIENKNIYWSLERRMECAIGNCGRCLIQDVYVCKDGPVFSYDFIKPRLDNEEASNQVK